MLDVLKRNKRSEFEYLLSVDMFIIQEVYCGYGM